MVTTVEHWRLIFVHFGSRSKGDEVREQLRDVAINVQGGTIENCGHFPPDEQPDVLVDRLNTFFDVLPVAN